MTSLPFALVTGASSGLGKAIAFEFGARKCPLILVALPNTGLQVVASTINSKFDVPVFFIETDLTAEWGPANVLDFCNVNFLKVGILINNAGIGMESSFEATSLAYSNTLIQLNILAVVKLTGLFLPQLIANNDSYILNISSLASFTPMPFKGIYSASKAFINSFSYSLRTELKGTSVSISVLCPGAIPTNNTVRQRITQHGWLGKAGMIEADEMAVIAVQGMFDRKMFIVPGFVNRVMKILMKIIPAILKQEILYRNYFNKVSLKFAEAK